MTETFEQKKQLSQEHFKSSSGPSDETTPKAISGAVETLSTSLGGTAQFVPVRQDQYGLFGWCSDGVLEKIKHDGGSIRFGWTIWDWPGVFLTAEFHAVWISPNMELVDITPKPQGESQIVFVADESYPADFDFDKRPINRRFRIPQEPDYIQLARTEIARMRSTQIDYESKRASKKGASLVEWIAAKQPRSTMPSLVDKLIAVCEAVDRKTDSLSGSRSFFSPDREYVELMKTKIQLMQAARVAAPKSE
jgi:hypothetical protein